MVLGSTAGSPEWYRCAEMVQCRAEASHVGRISTTTTWNEDFERIWSVLSFTTMWRNKIAPTFTITELGQRLRFGVSESERNILLAHSCRVVVSDDDFRDVSNDKLGLVGRGNRDGTGRKRKSKSKTRTKSLAAIRGSMGVWTGIGADVRAGERGVDLHCTVRVH